MRSVRVVWGTFIFILRGSRIRLQTRTPKIAFAGTPTENFVNGQVMATTTPKSPNFKICRKPQQQLFCGETKPNQNISSRRTISSAQVPCDMLCYDFRLIFPGDEWSQGTRALPGASNSTTLKRRVSRSFEVR